MQFLVNASIDFVGRRRFAMAVSLVVILVGLASLATKGGPKYSIDFTGGSLLQIRFPEPVPVDEVRSALAGVGFGDAEIARFGGPDEMLVRVPETADAVSVPKVKEVLRARWPSLELRREERVGPKIGGELRGAALQSILFALFLILVYISVRFEFRFAIAAIVALVHDVLVTLGAFSIADHEISLAVIAAFLTIVGYSLNDTIVVFDRIRENLRVPSGRPFPELVNRSINQSLARTIITSGTTIVVVVVLLVFGGEVLRDFAFALTVGVVAGTYSSVYVAAPLLVEWERLRPRKRK